MKTQISALLTSAAIITGIFAASIADPAYARVDRPNNSSNVDKNNNDKNNSSVDTNNTSGNKNSTGGAKSTTGVCQQKDVSYNLGASIVNSTACIGEIEIGSSAWSGNNDVLGNGDPLLSKLNSLFGVNYKWSFVGKDESTSSAVNGFDGFSSTNDGTWSVNQPLTGPFAISLKAGTGFSVYFFDNISQASNILNGSWSTAAIINDGGNQANLSHISLFRAVNDIVSPPAKKVPEPASLLGLGLIASGMVVARRRSVA